MMDDDLIIIICKRDEEGTGAKDGAAGATMLWCRIWQWKKTGDRVR
jgi:hypothetical protein